MTLWCNPGVLNIFMVRANMKNGLQAGGNEYTCLRSQICCTACVHTKDLRTDSDFTHFKFIYISLIIKRAFQKHISVLLIKIPKTNISTSCRWSSSEVIWQYTVKLLQCIARLTLTMTSGSQSKYQFLIFLSIKLKYVSKNTLYN